MEKYRKLIERIIPLILLFAMGWIFYPLHHPFLYQWIKLFAVQPNIFLMFRKWSNINRSSSAWMAHIPVYTVVNCRSVSASFPWSVNKKADGGTHLNQIAVLFLKMLILHLFVFCLPCWSVILSSSTIMVNDLFQPERATTFSRLCLFSRKAISAILLAATVPLPCNC